MIIGLAGKKQSGKSTVANYLENNWGFVQYSWATPIKEVIGKQIFGLTDDQMYGSEEDKEAIIEEWGLSSRQILQIVGTDMFRKMIREDFWVYVGMKNLRKLIDAKYNIVISDCRFPNEVEAIKSLGGFIANVNILGQGVSDSDDMHASETSLDNYDGWDVIFSAVRGDIEGLLQRVDVFLSESYLK